MQIVVIVSEMDGKIKKESSVKTKGVTLPSITIAVTASLYIKLTIMSPTFRGVQVNCHAIRCS
jgi:hypothetical protein